MNATVRTVILCGAAVCNPLSAQPVQSNEGVNTLDEVVVTGTRRAYQGDFDPLEIPQAELLIDAEVLRNAGALDLNEALDLSTSTARQNNFGGLWNSFAVRGFVGDENLPSNYLVNGFNAGRGFGGPRDLSGVEAVEILKGPRAAVYGRGEPGGTVNLVTKRPTFETTGELRLSTARFDFYRADIDWTSPLSDEVAVRLVGFYEEGNSFRDTIETRKKGFSPSMTFLLSEQTQLTYEIEYSDQEIPFDRGVVAIDGQLGLIPDSRFLGEPGDGPIETHVIGHQAELQHEFNDDWSLLTGYNYRGTSLIGFATENGFGGVDENGDLGRFRRFRNYDATYQVFRAELSGQFDTGPIVHRILAGADTDKFENDQFFLRVRNREVDQTINVFNPVYGLNDPLPTPGPNTDRVETQRSTGLYLQDQISITDWLDIRLGARYDDYEQKLNNRRTNRINRQTEHRLSPQYGIVFKANETLSFYAVYGENFRPLSGVDANTDRGFDPNDSRSAEVGVKWLTNEGLLTTTVALFKVEQSNIAGVVDPDSFNPNAIGEAESEGLEVDITGELWPGFELWFSYAYVDAEITNGFNDPNFGVEIPAGAPLLNIPENQFNLLVAQRFMLADRSTAVGAGVLYVDERNGFFGRDFELPDYTIARVFATHNITDQFELRLDIENLFEEDYYVNSFADVWVQPGEPINARVTATIDF